MHGDAYEMEDQRNWSDASYKTYIRPLAKRPAPYTLAAGEVEAQSVILEVRGAEAATSTASAAVSVAVGEPVGHRLPEIGLAASPEWAAAALEHVEVLRAAGPRYLVCRRDPAAGHGVAELSRMAALGGALSAPLWLELVVPCRAADGTYTESAEVLAADLDAAARAAREAGLEPAAVVACPEAYLKSYQPDWVWPKVPPLETLYAAVRERFPGARIGGGMHAYFTELNRKPPPADAIDFITHSTSPIVHAADDLTVMESLESLPSIMRSARALAQGRDYCIGPSAIGMRMNPYGDAPAQTSGSARVAMARVDPRQRGLLNAAWTLGYLAHAARHGVAALALSAPVGEHGIVYRRTDWAQPWFDEQGGRAGVYPVYHVLRGLMAASGATTREVVCSAPARVQGLAYEGDGGVTVWIANLGAEPMELSLEIPGSTQGAVLTLDETRFESLCADPAAIVSAAEMLGLHRLELGPYAVMRVVAA